MKICKTRKTIIAGMLAATLIASPLIMTSCTQQAPDPETGDATATVSVGSDRLVSIPNERDLAYDLDTRIVYYVFTGGTKGYMSPYIGETGKYCRYVDDKITEIGGVEAKEG